jgi:hypothetical protein
MLRAERLRQPAPADDTPASAEQAPLTHHEILRLVEPFTRRGRQVDMAASDRLARRLEFRAVEHAGTDPAAAGEHGPPGPLRESLRLEGGDGEGFRLTRTLQAPGGLQATLLAEGAAPAVLLDWVQAVPTVQHWRAGAGWVLALQQRLAAPPRRLLEANPDTPPLRVLTQALARVSCAPDPASPMPTVELVAKISRVKGMPAEIELHTPSDMALPGDLLAVLGLDWSRLSLAPGTAGPASQARVWRASLRLRGADAARSQDAETKLQQGLAHLARTFAEPPARFHDRFAAARWGVVLRRAVPLAVCLLLIAAAAAVPLLELGPGSVYRMMIFNAPPLLLVWLFSMRELPRIEIPPLPRPLAAAAWGGICPTMPPTPSPAPESTP